MERHIFSVTEVNELVKLLLDNEPMLSGICVRGEISNYKMYPSGHHYFSLKDPTGAIRCVMFKGQALRLRFRPENGMKVLVTGRVSVFPRDGAYQLYCDTMTPEGAGDLALAFEQLKEQLYKEGLFDEAHKKPLPQFRHRNGRIFPLPGNFPVPAQKERSIDLPAPGVHGRTDISIQPLEIISQPLQRRNAEAGLLKPLRQPLHRTDSDTDPGKRTRPMADCDQIHVIQRELGSGKHPAEHGHHCLRVGEPCIDAALRKDLIPFHHGGRCRLCGSIQ